MILPNQLIDKLEKAVVCALCILLIVPCLMVTPTARGAVVATPTLADTLAVRPPMPATIAIDPATAERQPAEVVGDDFDLLGDSINIMPVEAIPVVVSPQAQAAVDSLLATEAAQPVALEKPWSKYNEWVARPMEFNPDPTRAVWLSALFPGLGQVYNRRYWKLPIVVGAYLGLAYATSWNNTMLSDYTLAYRDIMDSDPSTKSYMDFFPPTVTEESLDKTWLKSLLQSRKNFYRRYRDLCIICMVGVYLLAMVDAYVDASLSHFDISKNLSVDWAPSVIPDQRNKPTIGVGWALNF